jgi:hypothetical protein
MINAALEIKIIFYFAITLYKTAENSSLFLCVANKFYR